MGSLSFDPLIPLAGSVLEGCYLLVALLLVFHLGKLAWRLYRQSNRDATALPAIAPPADAIESTDDLSLLHRYTVFFFRAVVSATFITLVVLLLTRRYRVYEYRVQNFDLYVADLFQSLALPCLAAIAAFLLRYYGNMGIYPLVRIGLWAVLLDIFFETMSQLLLYPVNHWVQFLEIALTGGALLTAPLAACLLIKFPSADGDH